MKLSEKAIRDFQKIWQEEFGQEITIEKAAERGFQLLLLLKIIYRPIPANNEYENNEY